jgi:hypothetical protein
MLRALGLTLVLLLTACLPEVKLQADSATSFVASLEAATNRMSAANKDKVDMALRDLVLAGIEPADPTAAGRRASDADFATKWAASRAALVVKYAQQAVHGRTIREIIVMAEEARERRAATVLAAYRVQLTKSREALRDFESAPEPARQAEQRALLQKIEIIGARLSFEELGMLEQPTISFSVANKGSIPVQRIFMHGKVRTAARASPLIEADLDHTIAGGLKPNESRELHLAPNMFSAWGTVPREMLKDAVLSLDLVAFEDAAERRYGELTPERASRRKKALGDEIRVLEERIEALEKHATGG